MANSKRPDKDIKIDYDCISINVDGKVNGPANPKCTNNNDNSDGFVYTSSTYKNDTDGNYYYNYIINKESGVYADIIRGADATDRDRAAMAIRNNDDKLNEGTINLASYKNGTQFTGKSTVSGEFVYNEGNSTTMGNGELDKEGITSQNGTYDVVKFYDTQTEVFSDQLTKVRKLTKE